MNALRVLIATHNNTLLITLCSAQPPIRRTQKTRDLALKKLLSVLSPEETERAPHFL